MRCSEIKIWLLLGYLVLLLNFGPSLHRLHFFGMHDAESAIGSAPHVCSCPAHDTATSSFASAPIVAAAAHDCAFCKFFDQYHAVSTGFDFDVKIAMVDDLPRECRFESDPVAVPTMARGSPSA